MAELEDADETQVEEPVTGSSRFVFDTKVGEVVYDGEWRLFEDEEQKETEVERFVSTIKSLDAAEEEEKAEPKKLRHGKGKLTVSSLKEEYIGEWEDDSMNGEGKYSFSSGATYTGSFKNNLFHGFGEYTWPDGSIYSGEWIENKMHGLGTYTADGVTWKGEFFNGKYKDINGSFINLRQDRPIPATMRNL